MSTAAPLRGALHGVKILDLTTMVMGPLATQIFGDLGADVTKIEGPGGDTQRRPKPFHHPDMSGTILNLHRNKKSLVLDLKKPEAREVIERLVRSADVFLHGMRYEAAGRLGLDYASVKRINPAIVYCGAYGFSRNGPYGKRAAYDDVIQAASGIAEMVGRASGTPGYLPFALCDKVAGLTITYAILAALFHRERTGEGQEIEVPMFEANVAFNAVEHMTGFAFEPAIGPYGWKRILSRFRKPYRTSDGYVAIMPYSDDNWRDFFCEIGQPEMAGNPRCIDHPTRIANTDFLYALIDKATPSKSTAEWMQFCESHSIAAMPVLSPENLWDDPQIKASGVLGFAEHPTEGRYRSVGMPVRFSGTPASLRTHAPRLGQDSAAVLREAGFDDQAIAELVRRKVIATTP